MDPETDIFKDKMIVLFTNIVSVAYYILCISDCSYTDIPFFKNNMYDKISTCINKFENDLKLYSNKKKPLLFYKGTSFF